jgi:retinol dehydrogenase-14
VDVFAADLSSQSEVRRLADQVLQRLPRIDVLVNNAGGYWNTRHITADGPERTFAINHLAPFLLTSLLLGRLKRSAPVRVVTVSSNMQATGRIDFDDLQGERSYSGARAYNQSKLANLLFTYELARRLHTTSVTANALHPGVVSTSSGAEDPGRVQRVLVPFMRPFMKIPAQGAVRQSIWPPLPGLEQVTGCYFTKSKPERSSKRSVSTWMTGGRYATCASTRSISPAASRTQTSQCWPSSPVARAATAAWRAPRRAPPLDPRHHWRFSAGVGCAVITWVVAHVRQLPRHLILSRCRPA